MILRVRRLEQHDLATRVEWFNNQEIYQNMTLDVPMSLGATNQWYQRVATNEKRRDFTFIFVEGERETTAAMGGLIDIDLHNSTAELYMMVGPSYFGKGIGKSTFRWLCNYGFNSLRLNRIYLTTLSHNVRAQNLYKSNGFQLEGRLRKHLFHQGQYVDRLIHGMLRDEWIIQDWAIIGQSVPLEVTVE